MKLYLYAENFITERFDLYEYADGELQEIEDGSHYNKIMSQMSSLECKAEIDANKGLAVAGGVYGLLNRMYISFKVLLNETAPGGRKRALFGCSEPAGCWPRDLSVILAIKQLQDIIPITIAGDRLALLERCVPVAQQLSQGLILRRQKAVDVSKVD